MNDNSTFNTDVYERTVISFKTLRRILVKYGKVSKLKVTRYYILQNEFLLYYKNSKIEKSISSFSLSNCSYQRDASKIKKIDYSIKVVTADQKKTFWLHPISNEEISMLERYIKCVSEGRFNNDQIIQQILIDPQSYSKQDKFTSAFSSHLQIGIGSSNTTSHLNTQNNRGSQHSNQDPLIVGSKFQNQANNKVKKGNHLQEEESESEHSKSNHIYMSYNSQMRQLEPAAIENQIESGDDKFQQQKQQQKSSMKQIESEQVKSQKQPSAHALQSLLSLDQKNNKQEVVVAQNKTAATSITNVQQSSYQFSHVIPNTHILAAKLSNKGQSDQGQLDSLPTDRVGQLQQKVYFEDIHNQQQQMRKSLISPYFQHANQNSNIALGNNLQNNEYLITLGQMSQNNMFTNQGNLSLDNKQNLSMEKYNGTTISQIFKNMDNNLSPNPMIESGNFIASPGNFRALSQSENPQGVSGIIDKDISAIIKPNTNDHSQFLDLDADLKFSSDEEFSNNKNQKLETVRRQYESCSPNANKLNYFGQVNNLNNLNNINGIHQDNHLSGMTSVRAKLFQETNENDSNLHNGIFKISSNTSNMPSHRMHMNSQAMSSTNMTYNSPLVNNQPKSFNHYPISQATLNNMNANQTGDMRQQPIQGPCNFSTSTLQNIFFPESQKNYTESPQGSFFSHKIDTNTNLQEMLSSQRFQQQMNRIKKEQQTHLSDVYDLTEQENISSDEEEHVPQTQLCIKQQVFCAGASRIFFEDALSSNNIQPQSQRNSRIGVITNYSFDQKTLSDTDLFEQEQGNFQKSAIEIIREEAEKQNQKNLQKRGSANFNNKSTKSSYSIAANQNIVQNTLNTPQNNGSVKQQAVNNASQLPSVSAGLKNPLTKTNLRYASDKGEDEDLQSMGVEPVSAKTRNSAREEEDMGNYLDEEDDTGNPAIANNVTYIIERYKEQNYNEKNSSFFNSHHNFPKKNDSTTSQDAKIPLNQISQNSRTNNHMKVKSVAGFRENASQSKRSLSNLTIDADRINEQYKENKKEIPQIKDKKEFYNKKNITNYIVPKMEETLTYLSTNQDENSKLMNKQLPVDKCINDGYYYLWSFQFQNSQELFKIHREENINFEYAMLEHNLLKIIVTGNKDLIATTEVKFAEFHDYLLACIKDVQKKGVKSEIKCLQGISKITIDLIKAETHLVRGLLSAFLNNKFQSFIHFKNAYSQFQKVKQKLESSLKPKQSIDEYLKQEMDIYTQSRFYFVSGLFNIGLSMIPNYFLKILSLIGIQPNKQYGYECLDKCIELKSVRSYYASLLLCIEYIELNPNVEKSISIIKKMIKMLPQCPLFYWMASLLSWRYAKPDDALNLINKSLWNCGEQLGDVAFYLRFEKGWYNISQFDWKSALNQFEEIIVMSIDIDHFDIDTLNSLAQQKKLQNSNIPQLMKEFLEKVKQKYKTRHKIILPHKCCLAALVACCYEQQGLLNHMDLWLLMSLYLFKKNNDHKTGVDEDISKLCSKYISRQNKQFIKYEILYFVKEITKLREDILHKMVEEIQFYYESEYASIQEIFYKNILKSNPQKAIDFGSTVFLRIVSGCLQQDFNLVYSSGKILDKIADFIPTDHHYILHHSYHWLARCQMQQNQFSNSKENLKKCLKYKKCEFTLENKSQKLLGEMEFAK